MCDQRTKISEHLICYIKNKHSLTCTHLFFKGAGITAEQEIGIASTFGKLDFMLFTGECKGLKSDIHISKSLTIALWKDIDMIEGTIYPITYGLSLPAPMPSAGVAFGTVVGKKLGWSALTPWMVKKIGTEFSVSIGGGVSPVDISFSQCTTEVKKRCKLFQIILNLRQFDQKGSTGAQNFTKYVFFHVEVNF